MYAARIRLQDHLPSDGVFQMTFDEMKARIAEGQGFIAALDQSGGSTPKALAGYGVAEDAWTSEDEMFGLIHEMRQRIIESPCFGNGKVIGAKRPWTERVAARACQRVSRNAASCPS